MVLNAVGAVQTGFAGLFDDGQKVAKLGIFRTRASSRADQNSAPAGLTRLMRSKVLLAAGTTHSVSVAFTRSRFIGVCFGGSFMVWYLP